MSPRFVAFVLFASMTVASLAAVPGAAAPMPVPRECEKGGSAAIANVSANGVTLNPAGNDPTTLELPGRLINLGLSTNGTLRVDVKNHCIRAYALTATVVGTVSGTNSYTYTAAPNCALNDVDTWAVPIGNDVADVTLDLSWVACSGATGSDHREVRVVDPTVPAL